VGRISLSLSHGWGLAAAFVCLRERRAPGRPRF
jgi:hypothetical protein